MQTTETKPTNAQPVQPRVFRHAKRESWGLAAMVWERDGKRAYQFEDGQLRVFKDGYYHLLRRVEAPRPERATLVRRLARRARIERVVPTKRLLSIDDQLRLFRADYPQGFRGEAWRDDHRSPKKGRRCKRHREAAIELAGQKLAEIRVAEAIERGAHQQVFEDVVSVLGATGLVPRSRLSALKEAGPTPALADGVYANLYGDTGSAAGFDALSRALRGTGGPAASWPMMTVLRALRFPNEHVCVRPSAFLAQAKMLMPGVELPKHPTANGYAKYLHVAQLLRDTLVRQGHEPADLFDVYDFVWHTLRPAGRKRLETMRPEETSR